MNNSVSFQGNIRIKSFYKSFSGTFLDDIKTTKDQDKKIRAFMAELGIEESRLDEFPSRISKKRANRIYEFLSDLIGRPFRNVDNQKAIHYNGNHISFGDVEAKWCGGETMSISLEA